MIRNLTEDHVLTSFDGLKGQFAEFCGCELCRNDVFVYALNRLPARYVNTLEGKVVTELALERQQTKVEIDVVVMEGLRKVSRARRCKNGAPTSGGSTA